MTKPPDSYDPENDVRLDPRSLRGLAHPLRVRLLGALREAGPNTATGLAARLDESSGATSYHLRQLEAYGFVVEDTERSRGGNGRERWWRAAHRKTYFDSDELVQADDETRLLGIEYLRSVAAAYARRMAQWVEAVPFAAGEWRSAGTVSDLALSLTPEQCRDLNAALEEVVRGYPTFDPEAPEPEGTARVVVQWQVLPRYPEASE